MSVNIDLQRYPYDVTENPISGTYDGTNVTFTIRYTPLSGSEKLTNSAGLTLHSPTDYSLSNKTITMVNAPDPSDSLYISYRTNG